MYYISSNKQDLEDYNDLVSQSEGYDGKFTTRWADIMSHKDGNLFAIFKHEDYPTNLDTIDNLDDWFNPEI